MNEINWHCDNCEIDFEGTDKTYVCPYCGTGDIKRIEGDDE